MSVLKGLNRVPTHYFNFKNHRRIICCSYNTIRLVNYPNLEELDGTNEWIIQIQMNYEKKLKDLDQAFKNRDAGKEVFSENASEQENDSENEEDRKVFKLRNSGGLKKSFNFSNKVGDVKSKTKCRFLIEFTCQDDVNTTCYLIGKWVSLAEFKRIQKENGEKFIVESLPDLVRLNLFAGVVTDTLNHFTEFNL